MFDIHKDIWSLGFPFILEMIHIHFILVLRFEIEPKQGDFKNVNQSKKSMISFTFDISSNWIAVVALNTHNSSWIVNIFLFL